jgi:serine/threonine protein kinase
MGMVYRARNVRVGLPVALKVLLPNFAQSEKVRRRFEQEAYVQAQLQHPNIVSVSDMVVEGNDLALVMELIEGPSLETVLAEQETGPWSLEQTLAVFTPVVQAIAYAHNRGVVHRDIKPGNILLKPTDTGLSIPKVTDFGLAKILSDTSSMTKTGSKMGTMPYMAPEQFEGKKDIHSAADVFALGILLWRMLAGHLPVEPDNMKACLLLYTGSEPLATLASVRDDLPESIQSLMDKACALDPANRYLDAQEMLQAMTTMNIVGSGTAEKKGKKSSKKKSSSSSAKSKPKVAAATGKEAEAVPAEDGKPGKTLPTKAVTEAADSTAHPAKQRPSSLPDEDGIVSDLEPVGWRPTEIGLTLINIGIQVIGFTLIAVFFLEMVIEKPSFSTRDSLKTITTVATVAGGVAALVGHILLIWVPWHSGAKAFAIPSAVCAILTVIFALVLLTIRSRSDLQTMGVLQMVFGMATALCFALFVAKTSSFLGDSNLRRNSIAYIVFLAVLFCIYIVDLALVTDRGPDYERWARQSAKHARKGSVQISVLSMVVVAGYVVWFIWHLRLTASLRDGIRWRISDPE